MNLKQLSRLFKKEIIMTQSKEEIPEQTYPYNIFEDQDLQESVWRIAHTKSRREKKLADFLHKQGIGYFLPMFIKRQPSQKRIRYNYVPVFTSYVFLKATDLQRYHAFTSNHIARVIEVKEQKRLMHELSQIKQALEADLPLYPYNFIQEGQRVKVVKGPLKGTEGIVMEKKKNFRLILNVTSILQSVAVDIDADMVEPMQSGERFKP